VTTEQKKMIIRDMTVNEISSVDNPAVKGATAVIMKSAGLPIRKNAAEIAVGQAEPLFKAADYGDAITERAGEIAAQTGTTPENALLDHSGTDAVLIELAYGERAAEMAIRKAHSDRLFPNRTYLLPNQPTEKRDCLLCGKSFDSDQPRMTHQFCDGCKGK